MSRASHLGPWRDRCLRVFWSTHANRFQAICCALLLCLKFGQRCVMGPPLIQHANGSAHPLARSRPASRRAELSSARTILGVGLVGQTGRVINVRFSDTSLDGSFVSFSPQQSLGIFSLRASSSWRWQSGMSFRRPTRNGGAGNVNRHARQIDIAAFAHAEQLLLAPVEYCRGTMPTRAAKSRLSRRQPAVRFGPR